MWQLFNQIRRVGVVTEPAVGEDQYEKMGRQLKRRLDKHLHGSLAIRAIDTGSCNGCELEIHALNNPFYDIERFGVHFVASPRHADVLLITGPVSRHMEAALLRTYDATPHPKWIISCGDCACCGGEFADSYAVRGSVSKVLPVDLEITGCPPSPTALMCGIMALLNSADIIARQSPDQSSQ